MNAIIQAAIRYSRTVLSLLIVIIAMGVISWINIPKEAEPDVSVPIMYVSMGLEGIAPGDAERLLLKPMEKELESIQGVKEVTSTGYLGGGNVVLEFGAGFDPDVALEDVRAAVDAAKPSLPSEADDPKVSEVNLSEAPVITISVFGDIPEKALLQLMQRLQDRIEGLTEVLEAPINGDREEVVEIQIDPNILQSYGLSMPEVIGLVAGSNRLIAAGSLSSGSGSFDLKVPGLFEDVDDIFKLPIKSDGQSVVLFGDIAEVRPTFKDPDSFARVNGKRTMTIDVSKRAGENMITTIDKVKAIVKSEQATWPAGLEAKFLQDKSKDVRSLLGDLTNNVIAAVILVMIVIVGALGLRSGFLVGFAIPGSFLIGFMVLATLGFTVNIVVLFSLILASGMLVDGAIVVVEYADRRLAQGYSRREAYSEAAQKMAWPIISSTATTLAAFAPLAFWPDLVGEFMGYMPKTLLITLTASLFMALIFVPVLGIAFETVLIILAVGFGIALAAASIAGGGSMLTQIDTAMGSSIASLPGASAIFTLIMLVLSVLLAYLFAITSRYLFRTTSAKPRPEPQRAFEIKGLVRLYTSFLSVLLRAPWAVVIVVLVTMVTSIQLYSNSNPQVEFFPEVQPENATLTIRARGNLSIYEKDQIVAAVEQRVLDAQREHGDFHAIYATSKAAAARDGSEPEDVIGSVQVEFVDWFNLQAKGYSATDVMDEMRKAMSDIPGIQVELAKPEAGPPQGKAVQVEVTATDVEDINTGVEHILAGLEEIGGYTDIEDGLPLPGIDWELNVDREQAAIYGVDIAILGYYVRLVTDGVKISTYRPSDSEDEVDIVLRFPPQYRSLSQLDELRVASAKGQVPLSQFLTREPKPKVSLIRRIDGERVLTVKAEVLPEKREDGSPKTEDDKVKELQAWLEENPMPLTTEANFVGQNEEQAAAAQFLTTAFGLALFMMFVILVTQFNSFYNAALILSAVILSTTGVVLGLLITGQPFGIIMTGVGVISLAGIVVNNNIVLIDTFETLKQKGLSIHETLLLTGAQRLRPVLLTTVTTILGLLPMVIGLNIDFASRVTTLGAPSGQWWQAMASAIVYGLAFATILTLVVTPCAIKLQYDLRRKRYAVDNETVQKNDTFFNKGSKPPSVGQETAQPDVQPAE